MSRVRIFIEQRGDLRHVCVLSVTNRDASIYLQPTAKWGEYHYGATSFPPGQESHTFSFREQLRAQNKPHLSLHQSGQVHIRTRGGPKAGPLFIPPLGDLRGGHVATITFDTFRALQAYRGERGDMHPDLDRILYVEDGVDSGRVAIYINGATPEFVVAEERIAFTLTISNAKLVRPLHVAVAPWGQVPLSAEEGILAIAGFQPDGSGDDLLYLRGL